MIPWGWLRAVLVAGGLTVLVVGPPWAMAGQPVAAERCRDCHLERVRFSPAHDPRNIGCVACHGGDARAQELQAAHAGMEPYPGRNETLERTCGQAPCHAEQVGLIRQNIMSTLDGMIELTRNAFGHAPRDDRDVPLQQRLARAGDDSYLRKMCVSCHLGGARTSHRLSLNDRGGGCSACHLQEAARSAADDAAPTSPTAGERGTPPDPRLRTGVHPELTVAIDDARCFGCHSRSGRISLNYVGLAETDGTHPARPERYDRLPDGRLVERQAPDVHSQAGLACIDCHTINDVMGAGARPHRKREQLDIQCADCHARTAHETPVATLTRPERIRSGLYGWTSPDVSLGRVVITALRGTPLFQVYRQDGLRMLRSKRSGVSRAVPLMRPGPHHDRPGHERLTCDGCHAAWAPQCDGCHIAYDARGRQWDHLLGRETAGRWSEQRWSVRSAAPALGVRADQRIAPFVPGMSFILERSDGRPPLRRSLYASLSPHTTSKRGRTCEDCHLDDRALGVIVGQAAAPLHPDWVLPLGWVSRDAVAPAPGLHAGDRSFDGPERQRIRRVGECLLCHAGEAPLYDNFKAALGKIGPIRSHRARYEPFKRELRESAPQAAPRAAAPE